VLNIGLRPIIRQTVEFCSKILHDVQFEPVDIISCRVKLGNVF
jgi:hypothetical protein